MMHAQTKFIGLLLIVTVVILTLSACTRSEADKNEVTITGLVEDIDWDDEDNVLAIALTVAVDQEPEDELTESEGYLVALESKGKELLNWIGATVKVTGVIETDEEGRKTIYVKEYEVIERQSEEYLN